MKFKKFNDFVNESSHGPRQYVFNRVKKALKDSGFFPDVEIESKLGYDVFILGKARLVNDGVGLILTYDGVEQNYYSRPKLRYQEAVENFIKFGT